MIDDATLLQRYATEHSEEAFAELVRRHLPLVYAAACRRLEGQTHRAADICQSVFIALARNASRLSRHPVLTGWLYTATRYAALDAMRTEKRRHAREREAHAMEEISRPDPTAAVNWERLQPFIDQAFDELNDRDREALLLRFFQNRAFAEIGGLLGLSEEATRKRVDRALDKLRGSLGRRGITSTSVVLASVLTAESAAAVPIGLAASITGASVATTSAAVAGTFSFMSSTTLAWSVAAASLTVGAIGFVSQQRTSSAAPAKTQVAAASAAPAITFEPATHPAERPHATTTAAASATATPTDGVTPIAPAPSRQKSNASPAEVAKLRQRYDPFLIGQRRLTDAQAARFVELKLAIFDVQADLQASVEQAGAQGGTAGVEALRSQLTKPMWDEIRQMLGPEGYRLYSDYERMSAYRPSIVAMFGSARVAIADRQIDQVVRLVLKHNASIRVRPTDISTRSQIDWSGVARDASTVLSAEQLAVVQARAERSAVR